MGYGHPRKSVLVRNDRSNTASTPCPTDPSPTMPGTLLLFRYCYIAIISTPGSPVKVSIIMVSLRSALNDLAQTFHYSPIGFPFALTDLWSPDHPPSRPHFPVQTNRNINNIRYHHHPCSQLLHSLLRVGLAARDR